MKLSLIMALIAIAMFIVNIYLIAMDKVKPTKSSMLLYNFIILIYLIGSALRLSLEFIMRS
jgi:hypothetical protein